VNLLKLNNSDRKWWEIVLWWEIRRIPYNIIMFFMGVLSFYICFVTIPLIYVVVGLGLNVLYTFGWIIELLFINRQSDKKIKLKYPKYSFISYLTLSAFFVLGISIFFLIK
jgi:hypothetical protein